MKKLFLMMGLACLFMVACNNAPKQQVNEPQEEAVVEEQHHCPFCPLKAEFAKWDEMDETAKAELNKKAFDLFAEMDAKRAEMEANGEGKPCCKEGEKPCPKEGMPELTEEQKAECEKMKAECEAKCAEMKAAWDAFDTKTLDEQKDLILGRIEAMGMGKGKCEKPAEGGCCEKPAE